jgi:hypothetical protein
MNRKLIAQRYSSHDFIIRFLVSVMFLFPCCNEANKVAKVERSFFLERRLFQMSEPELAALKKLQAKKLYVNFFNVIWNKKNLTPVPANKLEFKDSSSKIISTAGFTIVPVINLSNEILEKIDTSKLIALGEKINYLLGEMIREIKVKNIRQIQIDCEWTNETKEKYFDFLQYFRLILKLKDRELSAAIRFHNTLFTGRADIPPVNRGLLAAFSFEHMKQLNSSDSIVDAEQLKKFINNPDDYPIPLDIALPLYNNYQELLKMGKSIRNRLNNKNITVVLYPLDSAVLHRFTLEQIDSIFNSFK